MSTIKFISPAASVLTSDKKAAVATSALAKVFGLRDPYTTSPQNTQHSSSSPQNSDSSIPPPKDSRNGPNEHRASNALPLHLHASAAGHCDRNCTGASAQGCSTDTDAAALKAKSNG